MSKNRPKPAAALYFSGALSATPVGVHQKCRSANTNPDYCRPLFSLKPLMLSLVRSIVGHPFYKSHNFAAMEQLNIAELWQEHQSI